MQSCERLANIACLSTCAYCPRVQSEALGGWAASGDGSSGCSDPFPKVGGIVGLPPMQMCEPLQRGGEGSCSGGHACMPARCQTLPSKVGGQGRRQGRAAGRALAAPRLSCSTVAPLQVSCDPMEQAYMGLTTDVVVAAVAPGGLKRRSSPQVRQLRNVRTVCG